MKELVPASHVLPDDVPHRKPEIQVEVSATEPTPIDCRAIPWWFIEPVVGERRQVIVYAEPGDDLTRRVDLQARRRAVIHDRIGVEVVVSSEFYADHELWEEERFSLVAQLDDDAVTCLSQVCDGPAEIELYTYLDQGFDLDFETLERPIRAPAGIRQTRNRIDVPPALLSGPPLVVGTCRVRIAEREWRAARVLHVTTEDIDDRGSLAEIFITDAGLPLLVRSYKAPHWGMGTRTTIPWDERLPEADCLQVNGQRFVHWEDRLDAASLP